MRRNIFIYRYRRSLKGFKIVLLNSFQHNFEIILLCILHVSIMKFSSVLFSHDKSFLAWWFKLKEKKEVFQKRFSSQTITVLIPMLTILNTHENHQPTKRHFNQKANEERIAFQVQFEHVGYSCSKSSHNQPVGETNCHEQNEVDYVITFLILVDCVKRVPRYSGVEVE